MLTLYGDKNSRSTRVLWALEEAALPYDYVPVDLRKGEGRSPDFLTLNPQGKVPVLVDSGRTITESAAICTHIGDQSSVEGLVPAAGTLDRASYNRWMFFVIGELEQGLWTKAKHRFALPKTRQVAEVIPTAEWEFRRAAKALWVELEGREFLVGERFTFADLMVAHTLDWARLAKVELPEPGLLAYANRILARPALARARERES